MSEHVPPPAAPEPTPSPSQGSAPRPGYPPPQQAGVPRPAELLDRFLARLVDGVLLGVVFGILYGIGAAIFLDTFPSTGEWLVFWIFVAIISVVVNLGYYAYLEANNGATVGKSLLKLRVVGPDGTSRPTMEQAVRRNIWLALPLLNVVPVLGSAIAGLGGLVAAIMIAVGINNDTSRRQAWHDHFAGGTQVLKVG